MLDRIFLDVGAGREPEDVSQDECGATVVVKDGAGLCPHGQIEGVFHPIVRLRHHSK